MSSIKQSGSSRFLCYLHMCSTAFRGELTSHHPHFHPASPAAARDIDIKTAKQLLPNSLTVGIHMGQSLVPVSHTPTSTHSIDFEFDFDFDFF